MENSNILMERLYSSSNSDIIKKMSISSVLISFVLLIIGLGLFAIVWTQEDTSSSLSMSLLTVGAIFILLSIYRFFWKSKEWVYLPSGSTAKEGSCFFDTGQFNDIYNELNEKKMIGERHISVKNSGNIRLDYMLTTDHKYAAIQLFKYIPYTYEPASNIIYLKGKDACDFANCLNRKEF